MKNATAIGLIEASKETTNYCLEAAEEVLGRIEKRKKVEDQEMADLSKQQKKLREDIEACRSKHQTENLKKQRNKILSWMHKKVQEKKNREDLRKNRRN